MKSRKINIDGSTVEEQLNLSADELTAIVLAINKAEDRVMSTVADMITKKKTITTGLVVKAVKKEVNLIRKTLSETSDMSIYIWIALLLNKLVIHMRKQEATNEWVIKKNSKERCS